MTGAAPADASAPARAARRIAVVIAATMLGWLAVQGLGGQLGWDARIALLADLAAMAAFIWALAMTWRLWRAAKAKG